jgi:hypothetical protein
MSSRSGGDLYAALLRQSARDELGEAASSFGLTRRHVWEGDGEKKPYEEVWASADERTAVHYLEDPLTGVTFVRVRGAGKRTLLSDLATQVDLLGPEDAIDAAVEAETHNDRVRAVFRVAVVHPRFSSEVAEIFQAYATEESDPLLRRATLNAMGYRCWPECAELVAHVAESDSDPQVRETARQLIPYFRS